MLKEHLNDFVKVKTYTGEVFDFSIKELLKIHGIDLLTKEEFINDFQELLEDVNDMDNWDVEEYLMSYFEIYGEDRNSKEFLYGGDGIIIPVREGYIETLIESMNEMLRISEGEINTSKGRVVKSKIIIEN